MPGLEVWRDGLRGSGDVAEIRFVIFIQRSGDTNDDRVHTFELRVFGGGREPLAAGPLDLWRCDPENVGAAGIERRNFSLVNIKAGERKAAFSIEKRQRKPDIAESNHGNSGLPLFNLALQLRKMRRRNRLAAHNLRGIAHDSSMPISPTGGSASFRFADLHV